MRSPAPARRRGRVALLATAGLASLAALAVAAPAQAFNREGPHWPTAKLTVDTTAVPAGTFHDALADAAAEYTARTDASVTTEDTTGSPWSAQVIDAGDDGYEGYSTWRYDGDDLTYTASMHLNTEYLDDSMPTTRLKVVWEHETGHVLGLAHVPGIDHVMYYRASDAYEDGVDGLTDDEVAGIDSLY
ncbi:matrixin family metalloprotease [Clavibacter sp. VKM Ac-2542]|uniref:matrixin family metalloprotease n=1 Tax=Clavibacter sp. VKM Ac-2542 TaxID=2783811 RepID=UPI00188D580A|nr:matrixin family metalloprotease [Clavibacter sp. VKM Ac-2542]MBF4621320.1 matrixin family metalloprotease [Clavibacter sp. VKM Ac-2542]